MPRICLLSPTRLPVIHRRRMAMHRQAPSTKTSIDLLQPCHAILFANASCHALACTPRPSLQHIALFVKNLSYNVTPEDLFDLFGKFGPIRQVRQGIANNTKGTAFVVYEDVMDAKQACDKLNGFNFQNRYLVVLYHQPEKMIRSREDLEVRKESLAQLKQQHGID
ncbi:hypothetical protein HOO65_030247 [Ceratocystis lukuohia]|uniref:RRM domain-containing protein n=1 Tax=Ceratocystis lukuohia TaxID=2019550 RepID=A0ABR4MKG1_9PEZI